jgi:hypothetical protein
MSRLKLAFYRVEANCISPAEMAFACGPSGGSRLRVAAVQQCLKINQTLTKQQLQGNFAGSAFQTL